MSSNHSSNHYQLVLRKGKQKLSLPISANDTCHAQAQAEDICRALEGDQFELNYWECKDTPLSILFKKLAANDFTHPDCFLWNGSFCNNVPCVYVFRKRLYVRNVILKYLDIPKDDAIARPSCSCKACINPYHTDYSSKSKKNQKLSAGDDQLLLAFLGQGISVTQIAKALKVHRSTIYRKLKDERFCSRSQSHC